MGAIVASFETNPATQAGQCGEDELFRTLKGVGEAKYANRKESIIIDKGRMWPSPQIMKTMSKVLNKPIKIIATVRPITECISDFYKIDKGKDLNTWLKNSHLIKHLIQSYDVLKAGYEKSPENFCLIEYENLCKEPQKELDRISAFLGVDTFLYSPVIDQVTENDNAWGIENLHKLNTKIVQTGQDAKEVLGDKIFAYYQGGEFWNDKPDPIRKKQPIHFQHDALMAGDFEKSKELAYKNLKNFPDDPDICFNAGWAKLSDGDVYEGYRLLDRGRQTTAWGDPFKSTQPIWKGKKGTVLLKLERGLGDQLHQVRYARDLKKYGCTVIVSCSPQLAELISTIPEVDVVVQHEAASGVYHDYFLPAMSAPIYFGYKNNEDLDGTPYIPKPNVEVVSGRVGLRWQGFSGYEHSTKRKFPTDLFFNSVKGESFISLQRDECTELRPKWVEKVRLDTWIDTAKAIASCEMLITSCTSVAHLAGAMGVKVHNIVPIVPYYLWTFPSKQTPYYDTMKLFRQTSIDNWDVPFKEISHAA
tara:strand:+ start:108 stop:1703 length:1596 start_codon:yes stop_codon:yes gene_type:complete